MRNANRQQERWSEHMPGQPFSRSKQPLVTFIACMGCAALAWASQRHGGGRHMLLAVVGFVAGASLYHAAFGFTSAWRRFLIHRHSIGLRAQLVMIGATIVVFFPLLDRGTAFGMPLSGFVMPVGVALCLGAFLFGIGMQLGGGCGSGTLYTAGGGSVRMLVTLIAFVTGSLVATADPLSWSQWPALPPMSLVEALGAPAATVVGIGVLAGLYIFVSRCEKAWNGSVEPLRQPGITDVWRGPWQLVHGAFALAAVNVATLLVAGRPWGITSAFALWGGKAATIVGFDVRNWPYWQSGQAIDASVLADVTSIMNFGIMLGALAAAGVAGRFQPSMRIPWGSLAAAVLGGLLMGFGARLATGCNIGAFFSGVASGSLHGLVWLIAAIPGNIAGARLRGRFGMS